MMTADIVTWFGYSVSITLSISTFLRTQRFFYTESEELPVRAAVEMPIVLSMQMKSEIRIDLALFLERESLRTRRRPHQRYSAGGLAGRR